MTPNISDIPDEISVGPDGEVLGRYNLEGTEWFHEGPILFPNDVDLAIFEFPNEEKTRWVGLVFAQTIKGEKVEVPIAISPVLAEGVAEDMLKIVKMIEEEKKK